MGINDAPTIDGLTFRHPPKPLKAFWDAQKVPHRLSDGGLVQYNKGYTLKGSMEWGKDGFIDDEELSGVIDMYNSLTATSVFNPRGTKYPHNLARNGNFEKWTAGVSSLPDSWSQASVTSIQESVIIKVGSFSVKVTRPAAAGNGFVTQSVHAGKGISYWQGKSVTLNCWVYTAVGGNQVYVGVNDGISNQNSGFHTGGGGWELLSVTADIATNATGVTVYLWCTGNATVAYYDGLTLIEGSSPTVTEWHNKDFNVQITNDFNFVPHGGDLQNGRQLYQGSIEFESAPGELTGTITPIF